MKRSHIAVFFLGILVAVASNHTLTIIWPTNEAKADIPQASLAKPYPLTFSEYLDLHCKANYSYASTEPNNIFFYNAMPILTARGLRYRIEGGISERASSATRAHAAKMLEQLKRKIKLDIQNWNMRGFDIAEGDIEIDPKLK